MSPASSDRPARSSNRGGLLNFPICSTLSLFLKFTISRIWSMKKPSATSSLMMANAATSLVSSVFGSLTMIWPFSNEASSPVVIASSLRRKSSGSADGACATSAAAPHIIRSAVWIPLAVNRDYSRFRLSVLPALFEIAKPSPRYNPPGVGMRSASKSERAFQPERAHLLPRFGPELSRF